MPLPVVFGFYNESAAAKAILLPLRRKKAHFPKLCKTAIYNFIYYSTVDFFIIPCYNISVKSHTTNQKRLDYIISRVDIIMRQLEDLLTVTELSFPCYTEI